MGQTIVVERAELFAGGADQRAMKRSYYLVALIAVVACVRAFILGGWLGAKQFATPPAPAPPPAPAAPVVTTTPKQPEPVDVPSVASLCLVDAASGSMVIEMLEWGCYGSYKNEIEVRWNAGHATRIVKARGATPRHESTTIARVRPFVAMVANFLAREEAARDCVSTAHLAAKVRWQCGTAPVQQIELKGHRCQQSAKRLDGLYALLHAHLGE